MVAVVGHVEWTEFVERRPRPGRRARSPTATELWAEPAGGGAVVAAQLAKLAGALRLLHRARRRRARPPRRSSGSSELGLDVHAQWFGATRRALTHVDEHGERTITTVGPEAPAREAPLPLAGYDAVFFVAGDAAALRVGARGALPRRDAARAADAARGRRPARPARRQRHRPGERYDGGLDVGARRARPRARAAALANGARYAAAPPPGPLADTYGAGDSFAAALCFALARGAMRSTTRSALAARGRRGRDHGKGAVRGANHASRGV